MRTEYGFQVDAWGALIMGKAKLADKLEKQVEKLLNERSIDGLKIEKGQVKLDPGDDKEERKHLILKQDLGEGDFAKLIMRFATRGKEDLEISWRLFEQNPGEDERQSCAQITMVVFGLAFLGAGVLTLPIGGGCVLIPLGLGLLGISTSWWRSWKKNTSASTYHQFDSRALAQTVDYVLMAVLANNGFAASDLRVIKKANIEGLGELSKADLLEDIV